MLIFNSHSDNATGKTASKIPTKLIFASLLSLGLFACGDNDNTSPLPDVEVVEEAMEYSYTVTVTNLTYAQPLSPVALSLHADATLWQVGESSSVALEKLAESGDNSEFIAQENIIASTSSEGVVLPGASVSLDIMTTDATANYFTIATMLVNTNDAFSGLTGVDISTLTVDEPKSWRLNVYDAGTEANNEAAGTIPGPADGGTGYDVARDDTDIVSYHPGVVSSDDGLSSSVLTQAHRFDNPAVKVTITRTK